MAYPTPEAAKGGGYFPSFDERDSVFTAPPYTQPDHDPQTPTAEAPTSQKQPNFIIHGMAGLDPNDPRCDKSFPDHLQGEERAYFDRTFSWVDDLGYWVETDLIADQSTADATGQSTMHATNHPGAQVGTVEPNVWEFSMRLVTPSGAGAPDHHQVLDLFRGSMQDTTSGHYTAPIQAPQQRLRQPETPARKALVAPPPPPPSNATRRPPVTNPADTLPLSAPAAPNSAPRGAAAPEDVQTPEATKRRLMTLPRLLTLGVLCVTIPGVTNFVNDAADGPKGYSSVIETDHPVQDMTDDAKRIVKIAFPPAGIIL